jgi:hypothetical protein
MRFYIAVRPMVRGNQGAVRAHIPQGFALENRPFELPESQKLEA